MKLTTGLLTVLLCSATARAATECPDPYGGDGTAASVYCTQWTSRFDGFTDHAYVRYPTSFDPHQPIDVLLWFHAFFQGESAIADPRMHRPVGDQLGLITIGLSQRGDQDFLGDNISPDYLPAPTAAARLASKQDVAELVDQLSARFTIRHVFAAGASMGGYTAYRLAQLYPERIDGALGSVPAICWHSEAPAPDCTDSYGYQGSQAIYAAASAGSFDDKLFYNVPASLDDTPGILGGARALDAIMKGKPWYHFHEIAGIGHTNFFADDYNVMTLNQEAWLIDNPAVPKLREDWAAWRAAHPGGQHEPSPNWVAPASEAEQYLTPRLRAGMPATPEGDGGTDPATGGGGGGCTMGGSGSGGWAGAAGLALALWRAVRRRRRCG